MNKKPLPPTKVESRNLNERLDAFRAEMFAKFKRVEEKHRGNSVMDDSIDWLTFDWNQIEAHFVEEMAEFFNLTSQETNELFGLLGRRENILDPLSEKEAVDVGNMAFLLWWRSSKP